MSQKEFEAIVIGCSAGGVDVLCKIFEALPQNFRLPIVIVLHIASGTEDFFQSCFGSHTLLKIKESEEKESLIGGCIYFAPADYHLLIETDKTLALSREELVNFSRPSIDVLFKSAADCFGSRLLAVVLTGANNDGALGAKYVREKGGVVLIQSPETATFSQMPLAVVNTGIEVVEKNIGQIAQFIAELR